MKDLLVVMKFTMKDMIKRKSFIISTIIFLIMIVVGFNIPNILKSINGEDTSNKLVIVDEGNIFEGSLESLKNADKGNIALQVALDKNYEFIATIVTIIIGYVIGYFFYPPAIIASCLVAIIIIWSMPYITK